MESSSYMVVGASTAILFGDPSKPGVYVTWTKFPAGLKVLPHTHPDEWRTVVVLSGTTFFGLGDTWDESKLKA
jgi:quercetin dioxygenase-like cupin family protein